MKRRPRELALTANPIPIPTPINSRTARGFAPVESRARLSLDAGARSGLVDAKTEDAKPKLGLRAWMERVLVECDRAAEGFDADPVHDLRVALRRCRSVADGLIAIDPRPGWKEMKKAGKALFQSLGDL